MPFNNGGSNLREDAVYQGRELFFKGGQTLFINKGRKDVVHQ